MALDLLIDVAEVAGNADAGAVAGLDHEAGGISRVVQCPASVHIQLTDRKRAVVVEDNDRRFVAIDRARVEGPARQVDRNRKLAREALRAAHVIVMLVREDDRFEVCQLSADLLETLGRLARTEAGVDEDARAVALEV